MISIHAPAKGATGQKEKPTIILDISIHAPAKGATCFVVIHQYHHQNFNPRTREGCDIIAHPTGPRPMTFQSTHPRRVRLKIFWIPTHL